MVTMQYSYYTTHNRKSCLLDIMIYWTLSLQVTSSDLLKIIWYTRNPSQVSIIENTADITRETNYNITQTVLFTVCGDESTCERVFEYCHSIVCVWLCMMLDVDCKVQSWLWWYRWVNYFVFMFVCRYKRMKEFGTTGWHDSEVWALHAVFHDVKLSPVFVHDIDEIRNRVDGWCSGVRRVKTTL